MIMFYLCAHILLIRGVFSFMTGVLICYEKILHSIVHFWFCILKHSMALILCYRICVILNTVENYSRTKIYILAYWAGDFFMFTFLYFLSLLGLYDIRWVNLYALLSTACIMIAFNYLIVKLMDIITDETRFAVNDITNWKIMIIALNFFFVARILYKGVLTLDGFAGILNSINLPLAYGLFLMVYYILSEVIVSAALIFSITRIILNSTAPTEKNEKALLN